MNYQMIEYAVRRYIDGKGYLNKRDYHIFIKSGGYILGSFFAFVVTDEQSDNRIYEVTYLPSTEANDIYADSIKYANLVSTSLESNPESIAVTSYVQENEVPFFI